MPKGTPAPKISITVDPDVYEGLVEAAEAEDKSVSAWITKAVEDRLAIQRALRVVAAWEAEHGAFTEEEIAAADAKIAEMQRASRELRREWTERS